jgi:hypothetical protein
MTTFTIAAPSAPRPAPRKPKAPAARLGKFWRGWTSPDVYEVIKAVTADGEWLFARTGGGTWSTGHLPTETEVKAGLRDLPACRAYAGSGRAREDLERMQAETKENGNG